MSMQAIESIEVTRSASGTSSKNAHTWEREAGEHYVEMRWNNRVLFENEAILGFIHDPCCGWGRIPEAAREAGFIGVTGSDLIHRGFEGCGIENFLEMPGPYDNLVFNPPFKLARPFIEHACKVTTRKVCVILEARKLAAAHWMRELPLVQVWYLTPRPSMPPGRVTEELMISLGKDPSGGSQDFCWVVFDMTQQPGCRSEVGWLHRDRGAI